MYIFQMKLLKEHNALSTEICISLHEHRKKLNKFKSNEIELQIKI